MNLTDKCKEDFRKYISYNHGLDLNDWEVQKSVFLNALIIDFFDSKKYFISIELVKDYTETNIIGFDSHISFDHHGELYRVNYDCLHDDLVPTRNDIISRAIIKTNEIYNQKHK